ncbi:hypothetical protein CTA1_463 [Colletotrichum tanaceti]|uniref:Uncharacterized protein n=1 Tax=Colletotrichum tanaceti TaxID=1306861 RepID=A0A4U6XED7_9PEZI|nr:hypothetical protein CTA1_463 [Colletotrichum tanaceti]
MQEAFSQLDGHHLGPPLANGMYKVPLKVPVGDVLHRDVNRVGAFEPSTGLDKIVCVLATKSEQATIIMPAELVLAVVAAADLFLQYGKALTVVYRDIKGADEGVNFLKRVAGVMEEDHCRIHLETLQGGSSGPEVKRWMYARLRGAIDDSIGVFALLSYKDVVKHKDADTRRLGLAEPCLPASFHLSQERPRLRLVCGPISCGSGRTYARRRITILVFPDRDDAGLPPELGSSSLLGFDSFRNVNLHTVENLRVGDEAWCHRLETL